MFLSMVSNARNCKALSGSMFDQRFSVAASRAQDRMYLVRSVVSSDVSDKDIRASLPWETCGNCSPGGDEL